MKAYKLYQIEKNNQDLLILSKRILLGEFYSINAINSKIAEIAKSYKGFQKSDTEETRVDSNEKETTYLLDTRVFFNDMITTFENILTIEKK